MKAIEISRVEEEILTVLLRVDRPMYCVELIEIINRLRPNEWKKATPFSFTTILGRMKAKQSIEFVYQDTGDYNKKYYKITDFGIHCLKSKKEYFDRLSTMI